MKPEQLTKTLEEAHQKITTNIQKWNLSLNIDTTTFQQNQPQIKEFITIIAKQEFNNLKITTSHNTITTHLYNNKRGIRIDLTINHHTKYDPLNKTNHTTIDRTSHYTILTKHPTTPKYKEHSNHPTLQQTTQELQKLGTYQTTKKQTLNLLEAWRTPNPQEHTTNNLTITTNSSIKTATCQGICTINQKGQIDHNNIHDPNQTTYFHTHTQDHQNRQIHFITNENQHQYLIATRKGTHITIETKQHLFTDGPNPLNTHTNITQTDLQLIHKTIQQWLNQQTT